MRSPRKSSPRRRLTPSTVRLNGDCTRLAALVSQYGDRKSRRGAERLVPAGRAGCCARVRQRESQTVSPGRLPASRTPSSRRKVSLYRDGTGRRHDPGRKVRENRDLLLAVLFGRARPARVSALGGAAVRRQAWVHARSGRSLALEVPGKRNVRVYGDLRWSCRDACCFPARGKAPRSGLPCRSIAAVAHHLRTLWPWLSGVGAACTVA